MDADLVKSIAALAPHLKVNDTVFVSRDLWWRVVSEEMGSERHLVLASAPAASDGLVWYGTGLCIFTLLAAGLLLIVLLGGLMRGRVSAVDMPHRWILLNHVGVQCLTTAVVVPLTMVVEKAEGGWPWGGTACRVWLLGRLWLSAANFWTLLSLVFDRFLSVVASAAYTRWALAPPTCCRSLVIVVVILSTWFTSALGLLPTLASINKANSVLEEVCKSTSAI